MGALLACLWANALERKDIRQASHLCQVVSEFIESSRENARVCVETFSR